MARDSWNRSARTLLALGGLATFGVVAGVVLGPSQGTGSPPAGPAARNLPPSTALSVIPRPVFPRPGYGTAVADPVFGSTIVRISDQAAFGTTSQYLRHSGPRRQPWNSDGSRLLLAYAEPGRLLDGRTYAWDGAVLPHAAGGVWSNTQPDVFYSISGTRLVAVSAATSSVEVLQEFPEWESLSIGRGQGSPANDDSNLALLATGAGGSTVLTYDLVARAVVGRLDLPASDADRLEWVAVSQSGDHVVLNWGPDGTGDAQGVVVYDRGLTTGRNLYPYSETSELCLSADGRDVYVTFDPTVGKQQGDQQKLIAIDIVTGVTQDLLRTDWVGTDISCRSVDRPGWAYLSDGVADRPRARTGGFDEIYALALDGSGAVQRFAHARLSPGAGAGWQPAAVPSRDGDRVLWASDWLLGPTAPAYAFVASYDPLAGAG